MINENVQDFNKHKEQKIKKGDKNLEKYIIKGGKPLQGQVIIGGSKNAALPILAAAMLTDEKVVLENIPDISDIEVMLEIIKEIGGKVEHISPNIIQVEGAGIAYDKVTMESGRKIRGSYYLLGTFIGKQRKAHVPMPGGCNLGNRPIDQHLKGFEALGVDIKIKHGFIDGIAQELKGCPIYLDVASVGATINIMLAATLAEGVTTIENAAKEPHVVDVANFLNSMGANIKGAGTDVIRIKGVNKLNGTTYSIIPDQIEAGTFMIAAAATKGDVLIQNVIPKHLDVISTKLSEIGVEVIEYDDSIRVKAEGTLTHTQVKAFFYPGFPTDLQPQITTLLTLSKGISIVKEAVSESRFRYVDELIKMGANIHVVEGNTAIVEGVEKLTGAIVSSPDLRAGAALVIAGLIAEGFTIVEHADYIQRGYGQFDDKLCKLGAIMERIDQKDEKAIQKFKLKIG